MTSISGNGRCFSYLFTRDFNSSGFHPTLPKMLYVGILIYPKILSILINIKLLKFNFNEYSHERKFIFIYINRILRDVTNTKMD